MDHRLLIVSGSSRQRRAKAATLSVKIIDSTWGPGDLAVSHFKPSSQRFGVGNLLNYLETDFGEVNFISTLLVEMEWYGSVENLDNRRVWLHRAETTKWFLRNTDASVVIGSRNVTITRTQQVFDDVDTERLDAVSVDISNSNEVTDLLNQGSFTHVIHLAALQTPDCNADRNLGLQVNLAGTQNIVEALKTLEIPVRRFVFASSIAVYGPRSSYPGSVVSSDAKPCPSGPYGI